MTAKKHCKYCEVNVNHMQRVWSAVIGFALAMEAWGLRNQQFEHTLSHSTRYVFKTERTLGKQVFTVAWTALFIWFWRHVTEGSNNHERN